MTNPADAPAGPPPAPPESASVWEDMIDIFYNPVAVYRRRVDAKFGVAFVVIVVVFAVIFFATRNAMQPMMDAEFQRAIQDQSQQMTAEQLERGRAMSAKIASVAGVVIMPILIVFVAFLLWIVGKLFGAAFSFAQAMTIATYAQFPRVLQGIINGVQATMMDASAMTSRHSLELGPARFLDPAETPKWLMGLAGRFDLFIIWVTVLIGIGTYVIGRTTKERAAMVAATVWLLATLMSIWQG